MVTTPSFSVQTIVEPNSCAGKIRGSFGRRTSNPPSVETYFSPAGLSANDLVWASAKEPKARKTTTNRHAMGFHISPRVYAHPVCGARYLFTYCDKAEVSGNLDAGGVPAFQFH